MTDRFQPPLAAARVGAVQGTVYSSVAAELVHHAGEVVPLHVGDTWLAPPDGCDVTDLADVAPPGMNRYTPVPGWGPLRDAFAARIAARHGVEVPPAQVMICAGATAGLAALVLALVEPGRQVLIVSPAWPLLANMVRLAGGDATHVHGVDVTPGALADALVAAARPGCVAVYLNTPNNPSGRTLSAAHVAAVVDVARRLGLVIISDEVYEDFVFHGAHASAVAMAPERTVGVWSFSKGFGMAGYRVGALAGPPAVMEAALKLSTYTYYCAPFPGQVAAHRALGPAGDAWVASARSRYQAIGDEVARRLGVPAPEGGTFLFLDLRRALGEDGLEGALRRLARRGVLLAPGPVFGDYPTHARLCFTAVAPEVTLRGVDVLRDVLGAAFPGA